MAPDGQKIFWFKNATVIFRNKSIVFWSLLCPHHFPSLHSVILIAFSFLVLHWFLVYLPGGTELWTPCEPCTLWENSAYLMLPQVKGKYCIPCTAFWSMGGVYCSVLFRIPDRKTDVSFSFANFVNVHIYRIRYCLRYGSEEKFLCFSRLRAFLVKVSCRSFYRFLKRYCDEKFKG